jgi:mRNA-degrading endonuclease YafQ of YafQ-DinJ toxin-antitoxin module
MLKPSFTKQFDRDLKSEKEMIIFERTGSHSDLF